MKSVNSSGRIDSWTKSGITWWWVILLVIAIDLGSKFAILGNFYLGESVSIIPFLNFSYAQNTGAAFGFLSDHDGWQRWFFTLIAISISGILFYFMRQTHKSNILLNLGYAMVIGGALGNLFDRLVHGFVVDFIDFYINTWHFATFNIADIAISLGAAAIILDGFFPKKKKNIQPDASKSNEKNDA
ncbi:signal peptidase II [Thorsellia kenyensis]|uniref:Lipoprotein signal peptidase n=1 Tax=Thorsellia kenyensis TaxID=1549888 RepID=A0ABV6CGX5_9GAMM